MSFIGLIPAVLLDLQFERVLNPFSVASLQLTAHHVSQLLVVEVLHLLDDALMTTASDVPTPNAFR